MKEFVEAEQQDWWEQRWLHNPGDYRGMLPPDGITLE